MATMKKKHVDNVVGRRIALVRKACNLTQRELADLIDVSEVMMQNYESGRSDVTQTRLVEIAAVLQVPPAELLKKLDEPVQCRGGGRYYAGTSFAPPIMRGLNARIDRGSFPKPRED